MAVYLLARRPKHPDITVHIVLADTAMPWEYTVMCGAQRGDLGFVVVTHRDQKGFPTCLQCIVKMKDTYFCE